MKELVVDMFQSYSLHETVRNIAIGDLLFSFGSLFVHFMESFAVTDIIMENQKMSSLIIIHHSPEYILYATHILCWIYMGANVANILLAILLWRAEDILKIIGYLVIYPTLIITGISAFLYHLLVLGPIPYYFGLLYPGYYFWKIYTLKIIKRFLDEIRSSPSERRKHRQSDYGRLDGYGGGSMETLRSHNDNDRIPSSTKSLIFGASSGAEFQLELELPKHFKIPGDKLKLDHKICLDTDEFHAVIRGLLEIPPNGDFKEVAVKTLKVTTPTIPYANRLLQEAKIMTLVNSHQNVLNLMGVCVNHNLKDKLFLITEYYTKGTLDKFFQDCITTYGGNCFKNLIESDGRIGYTMDIRSSSRKTFHTIDLLEWAYQIACGMEYLHTKRVIHGCLQGKKIILVEMGRVKISDFSFAAKIRNQGKVIPREDLPISFPFRWSALEIINQDIMHFSTRTDVWSYGIVLYEMFSLGEIPYGAWDNDIIRNLRLGMRLEQPKYATKQIYEIMLACWRPDPMDRPNFALLQLFFKQLLMSLKRLTQEK